MNSPALRFGAFCFALFHIYCNVFASISELWLSAVHFGGFVAICAFMANERAEVKRHRLQYWTNVALAILFGAGELPASESAIATMPAYGEIMTNDDIAAVANYVVARFGAAASAITAQDVARLREAH